MTTLYHPGTLGPWACDDTAIQADGVPVAGLLRHNPPTVDGLPPGEHRHHDEPGMVFTERETGTVMTR